MNSNHSPNLGKTLADAIAQMPPDWALTPCVGKQNVWPQWSSQKLDRDTLIEAVRSQTNHEGKRCKWTGISVITGPLSDGLMAIDFDGPTAFDKYLEFSGGEGLPETPRWTSGRDGHFQILLDVVPEKWEGLKPQKIELPNGDKLELRWNQCSTLPPSIHPDTKKPYYWEKSDCAIAACPDFILDLMRESPAVTLPEKPIEKSTIYIGEEKSLVDILENQILPHLDAEKFYGNWVALKKSGRNLKGLCPFHDEKTPSFSVTADTKLFKCFGCGVGGGPVQFLHQIKGGTSSPTGKEFVEVVRELAHKVGVQMPDFQPKSQNPKSNSQNLKPNNLLKHPATYAPEPEPATEIIKYADNLLEEELTPTNQIIGAIAAAKRAGLSPKDFREILSLRQDEQDLDWALIESRENFQRLYQIEKTQINLHEIFPPALAKALLSKAESDRVDPVRILQSLLPVVGTTLGGRIGIELKKGYTVKDSHIEYPIFFTADIGHPSTGKSATQGTLVEPLQEMQDAEQERLDEALIELVQLEDAWKSMPKEQKAEKAESDENPRIYQEKYCKPKKWLLDEASAQALTKRIAEQESKHGCLLLQDELAGLFESFDQFTGGKGGQRQFILKAWNKPLRGSVDRVDLNASFFFRSQTLSLTGTIQPDVARKIFNVASDPDGMLSRFLPAIASIPDNFAQRPTVRVNVYDAIKSVIENLQRLPETLLTLPPATSEIFWSYWENLRSAQNANFDSNPAYSYFLGKQISYVGRFAIVIHCLENLAATELPSDVSAETMRKAMRLSQFYCSQFLLLQSKSAQQQPLEGLLLDILKFIRQSGGQISTRDLCRSRFQRIAVEGKKMTTATAAKLLREIAAAGFGSFEEAGNKKIFTLNSGLSSTVINCHQVDDSSKPSHSKDSDIDCHQMTKVYVSENFEPRVSPPSEHLIDGSVLNSVENSKNLEDIQFCHLMTVEAQTQSPQALEFDDSLMTVDDSDDSSTLNVDEIELLEMLQAVVAKKDAEFAKDVRGILKDVCDAGAADRKKVWEALGDASQKIFTELLAAESPEVTEPDSLEVTIQKITDGLVAALDDGPAAVVSYAAQFLSENVERAIALLESLKDWDAVEEIRDALS
ncbi:DUF3987 domain-containing protein [Microcoleus sp.]|uniref:DUF3987 domain-containing protein n=1 Tax=Microcoleus sp. TaxID=44472 RepID=UPI003525EBF3